MSIEYGEHFSENPTVKMNNSLYNLQNAALGGPAAFLVQWIFPIVFARRGTPNGDGYPGFRTAGAVRKTVELSGDFPSPRPLRPGGVPAGRLAQPAARSPPDPPRGGSAFCNPTVRYPPKTAQTVRSAPSYSVVPGRAEITGCCRYFRGNHAVGLRRFRGGRGGGYAFRCPAFLAGLLFCRNGSRCADCNIGCGGGFRHRSFRIVRTRNRTAFRQGVRTGGNSRSVVSTVRKIGI